MFEKFAQTGAFPLEAAPAPSHLLFKAVADVPFQGVRKIGASYKERPDEPG